MPRWGTSHLSRIWDFGLSTDLLQQGRILVNVLGSQAVLYIVLGSAFRRKSGGREMENQSSIRVRTQQHEFHFSHTSMMKLMSRVKIRVTHLSLTQPALTPCFQTPTIPSPSHRVASFSVTFPFTSTRSARFPLAMMPRSLKPNLFAGSAVAE